MYLSRSGAENDIQKSYTDCQIVCDAYEDTNAMCATDGNGAKKLSLWLIFVLLIAEMIYH